MRIQENSNRLLETVPTTALALEAIIGKLETITDRPFAYILDENRSVKIYELQDDSHNLQVKSSLHYYVHKDEAVRTCITPVTDKCEAQVTLWSSKHRWHNIKQDMKETGVYTIQLTQDMISGGIL